MKGALETAKGDGLMSLRFVIRKARDQHVLTIS